jgi:hypothetical protein
MIEVFPAPLFKDRHGEISPMGVFCVFRDMKNLLAGEGTIPDLSELFLELMDAPGVINP